MKLKYTEKNGRHKFCLTYKVNKNKIYPALISHRHVIVIHILAAIDEMFCLKINSNCEMCRLLYMYRPWVHPCVAITA